MWGAAASERGWVPRRSDLLGFRRGTQSLGVLFRDECHNKRTCFQLLLAHGASRRAV
jgi:hypothetical protein